MKSLLINTALFLISLIVCLFIGELALRTVYGSRTTTADTSSYLARQWIKSIDHEMNRFGYREKEFNDQTQEGVFRIAVVGDSITYGQGIDLGSRFSNLIEDQLNRSTPMYEVLNFGRSGDETEDHLETVRDLMSSVDPDYLLLQWFINDVEGHDKSGRPHPPRLIPSSRAHWFLNSHSILYYLVNRQWASLMQTGSYEDYLVKNYKDPESAQSLRAQSALVALIEEVRGLNIPIGIVAFPYPTEDQLRDSASLQFLTRRVVNTCSEKGLDCLDLTSAFSRIPDVESLWVNEFDHHPSSFANQIAADEIMGRFKAVWNQLAGQKIEAEAQVNLSESGMRETSVQEKP